MIVADPAERPAIVPVVAPTGMDVILLLLQAPPGAMSVSVDVAPTQMVVMPEIAAGAELTVTELKVRQPVPRV